MNNFVAKHKNGLSISGNSRILVKENQEITLMPIKDLYNYVSNKKTSTEVRFFDGKNSDWVDVKNVIKHRLESKRLFKIEITYGKNLKLTEDHSIYLVKDGKLELSQGKDLKKGDNVFLESFISEPKNTIKTIKTWKFLDHFYYVSGQLNSEINENIISENGYKKPWKVRYQRKNGKYGSFLSIDEFKKYSSFSKAEKFYTTGSKRNFLLPEIPVEKLSYLFGYYLGDGWVSKNRLCFAANKKELSKLKKEVENLNKKIPFNYEVRKSSNGTSYELRINNVLLGNFFNNIFEKRKVLRKKIPSIIYKLDNKNIREIIDGMIDSDGHVQRRSRNRNNVRYTTISKNLAWGLIELLKRLGIVASLYTRKPSSSVLKTGRTIKGKHKVYDVSFPESALLNNTNGRRGQNTYPTFPKNVKAKIKKVEEIINPQEKYVYDISVDHKKQNFFANDILVHNSATPERTDNLTEAIFFAAGPIIHTITQKEIEDYIIVPHVTEVKTNYYFPLFDSSEYQTMITHLSEEESRNELIIDTYKTIGTDRQSVFLCQRTKQAKILHEAIDGSAILTSKTKKSRREEIMEELVAGDLKAVMTTYNLFSTGIDVPTLEVAYFCAPIKSKVKINQTIGRVRRKAEGKTSALIVDFVDPKVGLLRNQWYSRRRIWKTLQQGEEI